MTATQVRQLRDFAGDLEGYARGLSESASVTGPIAAMRAGVDTLSTEFRSARDEYDRIVAQIESSGASGRDTAAEEALHLRVDALWKEYDSAKKAMLESGDDRLERAAVQAESASLMASRSKRMAYVLYALGTLLILYGRARKSLGSKEKSAA